MSAKEKETIRAFVAIELDDEVERHIKGAIEALRRERIEGLRLVRPEGVHLTLKFLGDITATQVSQVGDAMTSVAAQHKRFDLALSEAGVFPNTNRARVLWLGMEGDLQLLERLQRATDEALADVGFTAETQPFNPHLTIGRMHHRALKSDRRRAVNALAALSLPIRQAIPVNAISLMESALQPGGAVYRRIVRSPLAPLRT